MKTKCKSCGGSMKKMAVGGTTTMKPKMLDGGSKFTQLKYKKDGSVKTFKEISEEKFNRVSKRYGKQDGSKTTGTSDSNNQQFVSGRNFNNSVSRTKENPGHELMHRSQGIQGAAGAVGAAGSSLLKQAGSSLLNQAGSSFYKKGGTVKKAGLKEVPPNKKGLKKLPTFIRNKMGYAQKGGKVK